MEDEWRCPICQVKTEDGWTVENKKHLLCHDGWIEPTGRVAFKEIERRQQKQLEKFLNCRKEKGKENL